MSRRANRNIDDEIVRVRARLHALDSERIALEAKLDELERQPSLFAGAEIAPSNTSAIAAITSASSSAEKVSLFRRLFAGRADVFPIRWENRKTGKGGYAPACANEWVKGVCHKPQVRCGECPNQAFIPVSDEIIERHLRGSDTAGEGSFEPATAKAGPDRHCH